MLFAHDQRTLKVKAERQLYFITLFLICLWLAGIFLGPWLESLSAKKSAGFIYAVFSSVCHQIPARCFKFQGFPLAVCGRCLGIYVGFLVTMLILPFFKRFPELILPEIKVFVILSLPMVLDYFSSLTGFWQSPALIRFLTGFIWGLLLPPYFLAGMSGLLSIIKKKPLDRHNQYG